MLLAVLIHHEIYDNHINCFQPNCPLVQLYRVTQGEEYLAGITGTCYLQPGATYYNSNCGRVSCSWDTAIYFCQQVSDLESHFR